MNTWSRLKEKLLPPPEAKWLFWVIMPSCFLVLSAVVALGFKSSFLALPLFFALLLQVVYAVTGRRSLFLVGALLLLGIVFYLGALEPSQKISWNVGWIGTLFLSLFLSYEMTSQVQNIFHVKEKIQKELERDVDLWKTRFETLREKMVSDKEVLDEEMGKLIELVEEKNEEMRSLRVLISLAHKETRRAEAKAKSDHFEIEGKVIDQTEMLRVLEELNEVRTKHHETELRLEKAYQELDSQQQALRHRQNINDALQAKKGSKQPISLKDLAKNI